MKKMMIIIAILVSFSAQLLMSDVATPRMPVVVPNDNGGYDFIFDGGPGVDVYRNGRNEVDCKNNSTVHCKTVSTRIEYRDYIPRGTEINIWITNDESQNGVGYIGVNLSEDFDNSQPISFEVNEHTQTIHDKNEYESIKPF